MLLLAVAAQIGTDMEAALAESRETRKPILMVIADAGEASEETLATVGDEAILKLCPDLIRVRVEPGSEWADFYRARWAPTLLLLHPPPPIEELPVNSHHGEALSALRREMDVDFDGVPLLDALQAWARMAETKIVAPAEVRRLHYSTRVTLKRTAPLGEIIGDTLKTLGLYVEPGEGGARRSDAVRRRVRFVQENADRRPSGFP